MPKRRPNGDGMLRRRKDGTWEGRIVVGHKENGKPIFKSVFAKTQKEVTGMLHRLIEFYRDAELTEDSKIQLSEWLYRWLNEYKVGSIRESTRKSYESYIRVHINPRLGDKQISAISTADVQKMYNTIKQNGRKGGRLALRQHGEAVSYDAARSAASRGKRTVDCLKSYKRYDCTR